MYLIKLSNNVFYTRISIPVALQTSLGYPREIRLSIFIKDTHLHFSLGHNAAWPLKRTYTYKYIR